MTLEANKETAHKCKHNTNIFESQISVQSEKGHSIEKAHLFRS